MDWLEKSIFLPSANTHLAKKKSIFEISKYQVKYVLAIDLINYKCIIHQIGYDIRCLNFRPKTQKETYEYSQKE